MEKTSHPYRIEVSSRAKYMRLRVSLHKGVVVVVPRKMTNRQIQTWVPDFVKEQQSWIDSVLAKLQAEQAQNPQPTDCELPENIVLPALDQSFNICYQQDYDSENLNLLHTDDFELQIRGRISNNRQVFQLFELFFKDYAYAFLKLRLDSYSEQFNLPYQRLTVRAQKTRWGSCSAKKNINLNYRLIFLPEHLMNYVLLHELAHIRHMNHSKQFWALLESMTPNARGQDRQLNKAARQLPQWLSFSY